jgi:hypothetical protein
VFSFATRLDSGLSHSSARGRLRVSTEGAEDDVDPFDQEILTGVEEVGVGLSPFAGAVARTMTAGVGV